MGKSGSGKSTLLKIAAGLVMPSSGEVIIKGMNLKNCSYEQVLKLHAEDGFLFQDSALISNMTIYENLELPMKYHQLFPDQEIKNRIVSIAEKLGISRLFALRPAGLSMGQQKLCGYARAVLGNPDILYLDEPMANLDPESAGIIRNEILSIASEKKCTMLVVTHFPDLARDLKAEIWNINQHTINGQNNY